MGVCVVRVYYMFLILWNLCSVMPTQMEDLEKACRDVQEHILGKLNLTYVLHRADAIALASLKNQALGIFSIQRSFKDFNIPKTLHLKDYASNGTLNPRSRNVVLLLVKNNRSEYEPLDITWKPKLLNYTLALSFLMCMEYHLFDEQEPEITVSNYLQSGWKSGRAIYYTKEGAQLHGLCKHADIGGFKRMVSYKWSLPGGEHTGQSTEMDMSSSGIYSCSIICGDKISRSSSSSSVEVEFMSDGTIKVDLSPTNETYDVAEGTSFNMKWNFTAYPTDVHFALQKNGEFIHSNISCVGHTQQKPNGWILSCNYTRGEFSMTIPKVAAEDIGIYTLRATVDGKEHIPSEATSLLYLAVMIDNLEVALSMETNERETINPKQPIEQNNTFLLKCTVKGYPVNDIQLEFIPCESFGNCSSSYPSKNHHEISKEHSSDLKTLTGVHTYIWKDNAQTQGFYKCIAKGNGKSSSSENITLAVTDREQHSLVEIVSHIQRQESVSAENGDQLDLIITGDNVTLECRVNKMLNNKHENEWSVDESDRIEENIKVEEEEFTKVLKWQLGTDIIKYRGKNVSCGTARKHLTVSEPEAPKFLPNRTMLQNDEKLRNLTEGHSYSFSCEATGVPVPDVEWTKDRKPLKEEDNDFLLIEGATIHFKIMLERDSGEYECKVSNRGGSVKDNFTVVFPARNSQRILYLSCLVIGILSICCCIGVVCFVGQKKRKYSLNLQEMKTFPQGAPELLNPELGLSEKADLLPLNGRPEI